MRDLARLLETHDIPIQVEAPAALELLGDETRLRQALTNLLVKALKHSSPDHPVQIHARSESRDDGDWMTLPVA